MKKKSKNSALGRKIHKLLNLTLTRKLTTDEYVTLVLLIADVFDLNKKP